MENFIVSARKYRPTTFDTVVGQKSITETLKNAIKSNHVAQAFLFTGPRGVGKTTCARILAKTINCFSITENIEACNECESCKSFNEGRSLNIYELDAASNNSVDDIRGLIEQVRFAPQIGTHKVYIIDEVHMLSQAAFNAFLKTLEEPPKHAIFILATTEKHKIIPTILSRCQVFDFNRIQIDDIANLLAQIATKENITAEIDGLHIIAQKADGALRDALSMFDQIVSFSGNNIAYQQVIDNLNILDYDYYFNITDAILKQDISSSLLTFNEILDHGFDGHNFINGLAEHFRNLLVCQDQATIKLIEVGANIKERYLQQAKGADINNLVQALDITAKTDVQYKSSKNQRLLVEVMLMQLCSLGNSLEKKKPIINLPFNSPSKIEPQQGIPVYKKQSAAVTTLKEPKEIIKTSSKTTEQPPKDEVKPTKESKTDTVIAPLLTPENLILANSISINKEIITQKKNNEPSKDQPQKLFEPFTISQFEKKWHAYKLTLREKGKASLVTVFEETPNIEDNTIRLLIENKALEDEFNYYKADFLEFIRKELKNYAIQVETQINKNFKAKKAYTPQEKFAKMSEKNPSLVTLKQKLDMDIGYS
ncbi:MAG: DNA polymerase III subunit gamma/tau [Vicingus serpentipes]|nr:DNA polymerase III subunit gamma/tau [Vicingus serpentipes]